MDRRTGSASLAGGCHCGAIRYVMRVDSMRHSGVCHCTDCRRQSGAPMVAWALVSRDAVTITGKPARYASSPHALRQFCGKCGTGLFYVSSKLFPGMINIQIATLDDPDALPPRMQVQTAERIAWMADLDGLPAFARYPS